jgi:hypothetical protein
VTPPGSPSLLQVSTNSEEVHTIIARTDKARAEKSAAGFLFDVFPIGRRPHVTTPHPQPVARASEAVPPSEPHSSPLAGTRERAGTRRGRIGHVRTRPLVFGIGFAPEMIAPRRDHAAHFIHGENR